MWQILKPFFQWSENLRIGHAIADTTWAFPVIETIHILALTVMFGAMILIDLRLVGLGMRKESVSLLTRNLEPYMTWGLIAMLVSGFLLFSSEAMKCYANDGFRLKMELLLPAVLFQFTFFRSVTRQDDVKRSSTAGWAACVLSTALWMGVGVCGRAIGFV
jgi:hypothetical protein